MRLGGLVLCLAVMAACRPSREVLGPALEGQTIIYVQEAIPRAAVVLNGPGAYADFALTKGDALWALAYAEAPETLGLEVGALPIYTDAASDRRHLPLPSAARHLVVDDDPRWSTLDEARLPLPAWWIDNLSLESCAAHGGCYPLPSEPNPNECKLPCNPTAPLPPRAPTPPVAPMIDCPEGWQVTERATGADPAVVRFCQPPEIPDCPDGEMATYHGTCEPIDDPCPAGRWSENLPTDRRLIFVAPEGTSTAAGTMADPLSLGGAVQIAVDGDAFVLAKGVYEEFNFTIRNRVLVLGACREGTVLRRRGYGLYFDGVGEARSLSIDTTGNSQGQPALDVGYRSVTTLTNVSIRSSDGILLGGKVVAHRVRVQAERAAIYTWGQHGTLEGDQLEISSTGLVPISGENLSSLSLTRFVVKGGIRISGGSSVSLESGLIASSSVALAARVSDCVHLTDLGVEGEILSWGCLEANGLTMRQGGLVLDGATFTGNDVTIEDPPAYGISATRSTIDLERVAIAGAHGAGVWLAEGVSNLNWLTILDTISLPSAIEDWAGDGVVLRAGERPSEGTIRRALVVRSEGSGLIAHGRGALELEDVRVDDTGAGAQADGAAIASVGPELLKLGRIEIHRAPGVGLWIQGALLGESSVHDVAIEGAGLGLRFPALSDDLAALNRLSTIDRIQIRDSAAVGMCVGLNWSLDATNLSVIGIGARPARSSDFCFGELTFTGIGIEVASRANLELRSFEVRNSEERGFLQDPLGVLTISDGTIADNPIAIDASDRALFEFLQGVLFVDNGLLLAPH